MMLNIPDGDGYTARSDHGDRQALRSADATPHAHQRELYVRGSLWQRACHRIGQCLLCQ